MWSGKHGIDQIYLSVLVTVLNEALPGNADDICQLPYRSIISERRKSSGTRVMVQRRRKIGEAETVKVTCM